MEWGFLRKIDFFPKKPADWRSVRELCLATKSRNLGDALALTRLAGGLRRAYPQMRLTTYPRGFNPVVFAHNPAISRVSRLPRAVYGDDVNEGVGTLIHLKERFFGLPLSTDPRPEIFLTDREQAWAREYLEFHTEPARRGLPRVFIHPWGVTRRQPLSNDAWDGIVRQYRDRVAFWQVGVEWHSAVAGCDHYVFFKRRPAEARKLFALLAQARGFLGVDSGPMHVARAFQVPSLIFVTHSPEPELSIQDWITERDRGELPPEPSFAFLYAANRHAVGGSRDAEAAIQDFMRPLARA